MKKFKKKKVRCCVDRVLPERESGGGGERTRSVDTSSMCVCVSLTKQATVTKDASVCDSHPERGGEGVCAAVIGVFFLARKVFTDANALLL